MPCSLSRSLITLTWAILWLMPAVVRAQTDFYNTDKGRPLQVEDAYPVERRAFEIQAAPLRLERMRGGVYRWGVEPELAYGVMPRTQIEIGLPVAVIDAGLPTPTTGLAGIETSVLHNLNIETAIPALGVVASALLPVGGLAPERSYFSLKGIVTKTFPWARFHVNGGYAFGQRLSATSTETLPEVSQWLAGIAVDRTFPLQSLLLTAEVVAEQPFRRGDALEWHSAAGVRYQLNTRWALDGGVGRRFAGDDQAWFATFGTAYAFGLPWNP